MLLLAVAALPVCLFAREANDSISAAWERELELNEVVVIAKRPVVKQQDGKLIYLVKNDPYAVGLDGAHLLDRIPAFRLITEQCRWQAKVTFAISLTVYLWSLMLRLWQCVCKIFMQKILRKLSC